jgi:amino acid transporter
MCLPIAAYAFVGIEITGATALEARAKERSSTTSSLKSPSTRLSLLVGLIYVAAGIMVAVNIDSTSPSLPQQGWLVTTNPTTPEHSNSTSPFIHIAESSNIRGLPAIFTTFLIITAITAANTNLYVASRTLFGLTRNPDNFLSYFGKTHDRVPIRALVLSWFFVWVPFLSFARKSTVRGVFDVMSTMSSVSCVTVWFFECWAFLNFWRWCACSIHI